MKRPEARETESPFWQVGLLGLVALALALYAGSYFLIVRPGPAIWFAPSGRRILTMPNYRGWPAPLFAPMHYLDRTFFRPGYWGPGRIWTVRGPAGQALGFSNLTWTAGPTGGVPRWTGAARAEKP